MSRSSRKSVISLRILNKHITNGKCRNSQSCPIALAGKEGKLFKKNWSVGKTRVIDSNGNFKYVLCDDAKDFVCQFDRGENVKSCYLHLIKIQ